MIQFPASRSGALMFICALSLAAAPGARGDSAIRLSRDACNAAIEASAPPYRDKIKSIWVEDRLFMYVEVLKQFSALIDQDPATRAAIEDFKKGRGSAEALERRLREKADRTAGYADSLASRFNAPFYWHYPVVHVTDGNPRRVSVTLPTGVGHWALDMEIGPSSRDEQARALASARDIITSRASVALERPGSLQTYANEKEYLIRHDHLPEYCFEGGDSAKGPNLAPPPSTGQMLVDQASSRGRREGGAVMGFPTSEYTGPHYSGTYEGSSPARPDEPAASPQSGAESQAPASGSASPDSTGTAPVVGDSGGDAAAPAQGGSESPSDPVDLPPSHPF